jgi:pyocin large subunit-like protein
MNLRAGKLPWRRLLTAALAVVAIFLFWSQLSDRGGRPAPRDAATTETRQTANRAPDTAAGWGASVGFADARRLDEHFEKHGGEFGRITKQDYLRQAQLLRDAKVGDPILETIRKDGVTTRFDRQTGAFIAFNPNGVIRTFFKPNAGESYYRRQAQRGSSE